MSLYKTACGFALWLLWFVFFFSGPVSMTKKKV